MALAVKGFSKMKINPPSKMKISEVKKYNKIEVPAIKTSKADLSKANKALTKNKLPGTVEAAVIKTSKKVSKKNGK